MGRACHCSPSSCAFLPFEQRIASQDAGQRLQVAVLLAMTGALGQDARDAGPPMRAGVRAPNRRFSQAHDIGNIVLSCWAPGSAPAFRRRRTLTTSSIRLPSAGPGASLACAAIAALGCF